MHADPPPADASGDADDVDFRRTMADVKPRDATDRLHVRKRPPPPRPRSSEADERAVIAELLADTVDIDSIESGDTLTYRAQGLPDSVWRRLRRGVFRVGRELDLHGLNRDAARLEVALFLTECQRHGVRCVRIIHGKGHGSPNTGPVIKSLLDGWLRRRQDVLGFCSARPHDGGTGAVYVLLRAPEALARTLR